MKEITFITMCAFEQSEKGIEFDMIKKLPYGISNYEELIEDNYYYVDKTKFIEMLENLAQKRIIFLRPRKFGKTLFTSTLENYYDILKKDKFEELYQNTYIGKHPTALKNSYHILKFNFSGIDTSNEEMTMKGFKSKTISSIRFFIEKYGLDFYINENEDAENILDNLIKAFNIQRANNKIYVIIDEYDHFANELLGFNTDQFKTLVSKNGKIRKWYEVLKEGTETVIDRIFITGVAPITLDSLTSGFNIGTDLTQKAKFNEMLGFTEQELIELMDKQEISKEKQNELLPIMKENYDGYKFSLEGKERIYNSNMCLYLLNGFLENRELPRNLVDVNIASDYSKIGKMLDLRKGEKRAEIIEKTVSGEGILSEITQKFNPAMEFTDTDLVSMLYYLGYLTISDEKLGKPELKVPNKVMREIYSEYFMKIIDDETKMQIDNDEYNKILEELALEGKIDKITEILQKYLKNISNRDYQRFDEKYIKLIFYCISMNLKIYTVKSELEVQREYPDILLVPRDRSKGYNSVMIEFKYLKKEEENKLKEKQKEAKEQIIRYSSYDEIKDIEKLYKYTIVAVNDKIYVEKIEK